MALHEVSIPGVGTVHAGFDWIAVSSIAGEFKRLAARHEADWYYSIKALDDEDERFVAFAKKSDSKKAPLSGASLVLKVLKDDASFISLIKLDEQRYWLLVIENGLPTCSSMNQSQDYVGDFEDTLHNLRNIVGSYKNPLEIPFYTDCEDIVQEISYPLSTRLFGLEVLAESVVKKDLAKIRFSRYTTIPVIGLSVALLLVVVIGGSAWYWYDLQQNDQLLAMERKRQETQRRKMELSNQVNDAINASPPAKKSAFAYADEIGKVPVHIAGWGLDSVSCANGQCLLSFKGKSFATWSSYMKSKPANWPDPVFGSDFTVVFQPLNVDIGAINRRTVEELPKKSDLILEFGNVAQLSKEIGISLALEGEPSRVAGTSADGWVPLQAKFAATGPIHLLDGFVDRLPPVVGLRTIHFRLGETVVFEISGDIYANP